MHQMIVLNLPKIMIDIQWARDWVAGSMMIGMGSEIQQKCLHRVVQEQLNYLMAFQLTPFTKRPTNIYHASGPVSN